ncbi:MAG TPA: VWA domain-containing protein, partial [Myxococcota bacterium]|nr:VWA domain-containing protein [Myxococcota bacterium]
QLSVMLLNSFSAVEKLELSSALISFSDFGNLLMAPSRKHDIKTMVQALGPIAPDRGTNLADGLDKSRVAASTGTYDKVIHIVLTDGQPDRLGDAQAAIATLRAMGHVVVGFGVGPDALHLGNVFGADDTISESDPDLLSGRVYNYLKEVVDRVAS